MNQSRNVSKLAKASIWCTALGWGCAVILVLVFAIAEIIPLYSNVIDAIIIAIMAIFVIGSVILNLVSFLCGALGFLQIRLSKGELLGKGIAVSGILSSTIFLFLSVAAIAPAVIKTKQGSEVVQSLYRIHELGSKISIYAFKHNSFPIPDKWCDLLVADEPNAMEFLRSIKHIKKEDTKQCIYAINPDCEPNSYGDTVLVFETKSGWNQFGGPELMSFDNQSVKGACVLFRDYHTEFVRPDEVGKLKWKAEPNEMEQPVSR